MTPRSVPSSQARLRELPAVDQLAAALCCEGGGACPSRTEAIAIARSVLAERRRELLAGMTADADLLARGRARLAGSLRPVLNGTGIVIHTNLGRAPLAQAAVEAVARAAGGYVNLEHHLASGRRGRRDDHVTESLCELTGAEAALVVNNGAAAVLIAVAAIAGPHRSVVISRGQLVEIGGGFRIPDVIAQARARTIEVGTTNRTHLEDYRTALRTGGDVLLRVHPSNFRAVGFVADVSIEELCGLGAPVIDDVGSGALADGLPLLADEPSVRRSVSAGAAVTCFSGDKLLGGPQAGLLVGAAGAIDACRRHPLARAMRIGRLPLAALAATLAFYRDPERARREIPVLAMLGCREDMLGRRAARLADASGGEVIESVAKVGGGALPLAELCGPAVALPGDPERLAKLLREGNPPLVARISDGRLVVDPRTLADEELDCAGRAMRTARLRIERPT